MFRFAARNEKTVKPLKTNDHAKIPDYVFVSQGEMFLSGLRVWFSPEARSGRFSFAARQQRMSAMGPNERKKVARKRS